MNIHLTVVVDVAYFNSSCSTVFYVDVSVFESPNEFGIYFCIGLCGLQADCVPARSSLSWVPPYATDDIPSSGGILTETFFNPNEPGDTV